MINFVDISCQLMLIRRNKGPWYNLQPSFREEMNVIPENHLSASFLLIRIWFTVARFDGFLKKFIDKNR